MSNQARMRPAANYLRAVAWRAALGLSGLLGMLAAGSPASAQALPHCAELASDPRYGIAANTDIIAGSASSAVVPAAPAQPARLPFAPQPSPPTPAYCQVYFTYSSLAGPAHGYDVGQRQMIRIGILLPLSAVDGGAGRVQGNWNGDDMTSASPGLSNQLTWADFEEGLNNAGPDSQGYAIRLGYVGSETDTGQHNIDPSFILIQNGPLAHTFAQGTIADWTYRATHYGHEWALQLAKTYYGRPVHHSYYNGCSGGGFEGMGQLQHYGDEYDGFLIGAPAYYWQQLWLSDSWPALVFKKLVQQGGKLPTDAQDIALNTAVYRACDVEGSDRVADGIIADPRACTFNAKANVCGAVRAPSAPDCLTPGQAAAYDRIWDGPRNHLGLRIWYAQDRGVRLTGGFLPLSTRVSMRGGDPLVIRWAEKNLGFDPNNVYADAESLAMAGSPPGGITYEDMATRISRTLGGASNNADTDLSKAVAHGTKVIQLHGGADGAIRMRQDIDYYRRVGVWYGKGRLDFNALQSWYRLFLMPNVGHCGGGNGPAAIEPFRALVRWVEQGVPPDYLPAVTAPPAPAEAAAAAQAGAATQVFGASTAQRTVSAGSAAPPASPTSAPAPASSAQPPAIEAAQLAARALPPLHPISRPLCPFPRTAIYNGSGSTAIASSFHCGGNLETPAAICSDLRLRFGDENGAELELRGIGAVGVHCPRPMP